MLYIDPHIHCISRITDDYAAQFQHGVRVVIEPSFWLGQPRTSVGTFRDYFLMIQEWEAQRAMEKGIHHRCLIALNPKEANDDMLREPVLEILPEFLDHPNVLGVGEVGYDAITPAEEDAMIRQINMAIERDMPVMVHTPHRDKARGTERTMDVVEGLGIDPSRVIIDHSTEETTKMILDRGFWAGHTVYPNTKLTPERFVNLYFEFGTERMMVNSSADWGDADPLNVPKTAALIEARGGKRADIQRLVWGNVIEFYGVERFRLPADLLEAAGMQVKN
jgi:uncharacterized protein